MTANAGKVTHKYEVKNVRVVLDILNFLCASHSGEKLSPFARKMGGVSKNRLFRTLSTLETEAFVSKSSEGDYQLGPAAYGLAKGILLDVDGAVTLRPVMRRLGATTREAVYLGTVVDGEVLLIDFEESVQKVRAINCLGRAFTVTDGTLVEEAAGYRVYAAENSLLGEVTTLSVVFSDIFTSHPVALVLVAPSGRISQEQLVSGLLPIIAGHARDFVDTFGFLSPASKSARAEEGELSLRKQRVKVSIEK